VATNDVVATHLFAMPTCQAIAAGRRKPCGGGWRVQTTARRAVATAKSAIY